MTFAGAIGVAFRPMGAAFCCTGVTGLSPRRSACCSGALGGALGPRTSFVGLGLLLRLVFSRARFALLISRMIAGTSSALFAVRCTTVTDVDT